MRQTHLRQDDTSTQQAQLKSRLPAFLGVATMVFGIFAMWIIWLVGDHDPEQPGFYDSAAGTLGDLLLPFIIYLLVSGCLVASNRHTVEPISVLAGLVGSAGGAASQLAWVTDEHAGPNWVLPSTHYLSIAGWYHALYLVVMSGIVSCLSVELVLRVRSTLRSGDAEPADVRTVRTILGGDGAALLVASGLVFVITVWIDSRSSIETAASTATMALLVSIPILLFGSLLLAIGVAIRYFSAALVIGVATGAAIWILLTNPPALDLPSLVFPLVSTVLIGAAAYMMMRRAPGLPTRELPVRSASVLLLPATVVIAAGLGTPWGLFVAAGVPLAAIMSYRIINRVFRLSTEARMDLSDGSALVATIVAVNCVAASLPTTSDFRAVFAAILAVAVAVAIARIVGRFGFRSWRHMWSAERLASSTGLTDRLVGVTVWTWSLAALVLVGSLLALVPIVAESAFVDIARGASLPDGVDVGYLFGGGLVVGLLGMGHIRRLSKRPPSYGLDTPTVKESPSVLNRVSGYTALAFSLPLAVWLVNGHTWHGLSSWVALIISVVAFFHTLETLLANSVVLAWSRVTVVDCGIAGWAALAGSLVLFHGLNGGQGRELNILGALVLITACFALRGALLLTASGVLYSRSRWAFGTIWPVSWTTTQDELARAFVILFVGWLPATVLRKVPDDPGLALVAVGLVLLTMLLLLTEVFRFGFARWLQHAYEQRESRFQGRYKISEPDVANFDGVWKCALQYARDGLGALIPTLKRRSTPLTGGELLTALGSHLGLLVLLTAFLAISTVAGIVAFGVAMTHNYTIDEFQNEVGVT